MAHEQMPKNTSNIKNRFVDHITISHVLLFQVALERFDALARLEGPRIV